MYLRQGTDIWVKEWHRSSVIRGEVFGLRRGRGSVSEERKGRLTGSVSWVKIPGGYSLTRGS